MALDLRANTAVDVLIGPFVDDSDGNTDETGLTLTQADIRLSKNAQNMAQKNDANAATHDELGYYNCPLNATDTNTEGTLVLAVHESGALPVRHEYNIMAEAAWDSLYVAKDTGYMDVNVKAVSEDTTAADNLESACDNYSVTRGLSGTALPAAAADDAGGIPISDDGGLDMDSILEKMLAYFQLLMRSDAAIETDNATELTAINANGGSGAGNFSSQTDSGEAIRDHIGDGTSLSEAGGDGDHLTAINLPNQTMDITGDITGNLSGSVGSVTTVSDKTGYALSAAGNTAVIDEFETQAAADPTGFKVNVMEINGTAQTANDNGADINAILTDTGTTLENHLTDIKGTGFAKDTDSLVNLAHIGADADTLETLSDQIDVAQNDLDELTNAGTLSSVRLALMVDRIYTRLFHEINLTDADGTYQIRNSGDSGNIATGQITDDDTTTDQAKTAWV